MENLKRTALYDWHVAHGANMAPFGQYEMPLWYREGVKAEHLAVIETAGIFDTSHMAAVSVRGSGARKLLQYCFTKDMEECIGPKKLPLAEGRCVYGVFLNEDGTLLDDAIISQFSESEYLVVVNAGMGAAIASRLAEFSSDDTAIANLTDGIGKMDIQGPLSARILRKILQNPDDVFSGFPYFSFKGSLEGVGSVSEVRLTDGTSLLLSRTGYTGEFGFELYVPRDRFAGLWEAVVKAGEEEDMLVCGLAARDSLRAGAVLPLSHQDIGDWPFCNNPWPFALAWNEAGDGFTKDFLGSEALLSAVDNADYTLAFAGYDPRKIAAGEHVYVTTVEGERIGTILTCATDMAIGRVDGEIFSITSSAESGRPDDFSPKGLSCGFIRIDRNLAPGTEVILTDGKRKKIKVEIRGDVRPARTARRPMKEMI